MTKPARPANLADVSTWTDEQMAYAAPLIITKAVAAASETYAQARELMALRPLSGLDAATRITKIADRYTKTVLFWQQVQLGERPKVPTFLREIKVGSYEQTNGRVRNHKTRNPGPKDWGVWSA